MKTLTRPQQTIFDESIREALGADSARQPSVVRRPLGQVVNVGERTLWLSSVEVAYKDLSDRNCRLAVFDTAAKSSILVPVPDAALYDTCRAVRGQWGKVVSRQTASKELNRVADRFGDEAFKCDS